MNRQVINLEICDKLAEFFSKDECKDLRFMQGLHCLGLLTTSEVNPLNNRLFIRDNFNDESDKTYKQLNDSLEEIRLNNEKEDKK